MPPWAEIVEFICLYKIVFAEICSELVGNVEPGIWQHGDERV